jgi:hypothetical protein
MRNTYPIFAAMKNHVRIYLDLFHYGEQDFIPCEIPGCTRRAVDVAHIHRRGAGGTKLLDYEENLMGKCRQHHNLYGDKVQFKDWLTHVHLFFLKLHAPATPIRPHFTHYLSRNKPATAPPSGESPPFIPFYLDAA